MKPKNPSNNELFFVVGLWHDLETLGFGIGLKHISSETN